MPTGHSFAKYVYDKCFDKLYTAAEKYVSYNWKQLDLRAWHLDEKKYVSLLDANIQRVYVPSKL